MADLSKGFKDIWMKGMEAISDSASKVASNTRYKINEMNMLNRRQEILADFGTKAYALWQKGESFPDELNTLLGELDQLEAALNEIRAAREAKAAAQQEKQAAEKAAEEAVKEPSSEKEEKPLTEPVPVIETKHVGEFVDDDDMTAENQEEPAAKSPFAKSPLEEKADELADRVKDMLTAVGGTLGGVMERMRSAASEKKAAAPERPAADAQEDVPEEEAVPTIQVEEAAEELPEEPDDGLQEESTETGQSDDGKIIYE